MEADEIRRRDALATIAGVTVGTSLSGCTDGGANGGEENGSVAGDSSGDEPIELTLTDPWPSGHFHHRLFVPDYINRIEEFSDTEVTVEHFGEGQLASSDELLTNAQQGTTDLSGVYPAYHSSELTLHQVSELPALYSSVEVGSQAYWETVQSDVLREESSNLGLRPVAAYVDPTYKPCTIEGVDGIRTVGDWDGLSIRTPGGILSITLEELGATPVEVPPEDLYTAGDQGTVDGYILGDITLESFDLVDFLATYTTNINTGTFTHTYFMAEDNFQNLPGDVQEAILTAADETIPEMGRAVDEEVEQLQTEYEEEYGIDVFESEHADEHREVMEPVQDIWVENRESEGSPGQEVYDAFTSALESFRN